MEVARREADAEPGAALVMDELQVALTARVKAEFSVQRLEAKLVEERASATSLAAEHASAIAALKLCRDDADRCKRDVEAFLRGMRKSLVKERRKLSGERSLPWESERPKGQGPCEKDKRMQLLNKVKAWDKFVESHERLAVVKDHATAAIDQASSAAASVAASPKSQSRREVHQLQAQLGMCQEALEKTTCALQLATIAAEKAHVDQAELHKLDLERFRNVLRRRQEASEEECAAYKCDMDAQVAAVQEQMKEVRAATDGQLRRCKEHFDEELRRKGMEFQLQERMLGSVRLNEAAKLGSRHEKALSHERSTRDEFARLARGEAEKEARERERVLQAKHASELESLHQMHVEQQQRLSDDCAAEIERKAGFHRRDIADGIAHALAEQHAGFRTELLETENRHMQDLVDHETRAQVAQEDSAAAAAAALESLRRQQAAAWGAKEDAAAARAEEERSKRTSEVREADAAKLAIIESLTLKLEQARAANKELERASALSLEKARQSVRAECEERLERTVADLEAARAAEVAHSEKQGQHVLEEQALHAKAAALRAANAHERAISELLAKQQSEAKHMRLDFEKREMVAQKDMDVALKTQLLELESQWRRAHEHQHREGQDASRSDQDASATRKELERAVEQLAKLEQQHQEGLREAAQAAERANTSSATKVAELERGLAAARAQCEAQSTQNRQTAALEEELRQCVERLDGFQQESERERASRRDCEELQQRVAELEAALVCGRAESQIALAELGSKHQAAVATSTEDVRARLQQCAQEADATLQKRVEEVEMRLKVERREVEAHWREKLLAEQAHSEAKVRELADSHAKEAARAAEAHTASQASLRRRLEADALAQHEALGRAHAESTELVEARCAQQAELAQEALRQTQQAYKAELADVEARCRQSLKQQELGFEQCKLEQEAGHAAELDQLRAEAMRAEVRLREEHETVNMEREKERCSRDALDATETRKAFERRLASVREEAGLVVQQREADHVAVVREISRAHASELELAEKQSKVSMQQLEAHFASELNVKEAAFQRRFDELVREMAEITEQPPPPPLPPLPRSPPAREGAAPVVLRVDCSTKEDTETVDDDDDDDDEEKEKEAKAEKKKVAGAFFEVDEHNGWTERVYRASGDSQWVHKTSGRSRKSSPRGLASPQQRFMHDQTPAARQRRQTLEHMSKIHMLKQTIGTLQEKHEDEVSEQLEKKLFSAEDEDDDEDDDDDDDEKAALPPPAPAPRKPSLDEQYRVQRGQQRQFAFDFAG